MPSSKLFPWFMLLVLAGTVIVYTHGLNGPFLFDDHVHITKNQWVKIDSLTWSNLAQAWDSSFSNFPSNRPLSQLTFGINHALSGLDPWCFKATNLAIHLATGLLVFVFSRLAYRAIAGDADDGRKEKLLAVAVAAAWLLHPMHVSTVLYAVQRMALLSSLSLVAALTCYFWGRLQIAGGRSGVAWILAAVPIAMVGFLAKENTVLLPLLLLASELTLLRGVATAGRRGFIRFIWALFIAAPLLAGLAYFATHHGLLSYDARPFTLEERVLTQPRVLWLYLRWLFVPDISAFGLFHDDIPISTGLLNPLSTIFSILGWVVLGAAGILLRRKAPVFAFAVLFFLASHALESTVFPLEMVFEHRNYLASIGPLFFLAYLITIASAGVNVRSLAMTVGTLLLLSYGAVTYIRVDSWSSYQKFIFNAAENHPHSPRSNFMAAQILISALGYSQGDATDMANTAETFLNKGLAADPRCINCMFGLVILDLHQDKRPPPALIDRLASSLESGYVGPTKVSIGQFSYLVKWMRAGGTALTASQLETIFDAALANTSWVRTGRGGIEAAYREYYEFVALDLEAALIHAQAAVKAWPQQWKYHMNLARVLRKLGRTKDALAANDAAARVAGNERQKRETAEGRANIERDVSKIGP